MPLIKMRHANYNKIVEQAAEVRRTFLPVRADCKSDQSVDKRQ